MTPEIIPIFSILFIANFFGLSVGTILTIAISAIAVGFWYIYAFQFILNPSLCQQL